MLPGLTFCTRVAALALLLATWPGLGAAYAAGFRPAGASEHAGPEARRVLQMLLDTVDQGAATTYRTLGLEAGKAVQEFYHAGAYQPVWTQESGWNPAAAEALDWLARAEEFGLPRHGYGRLALTALPDSLRRVRTAVRRGALLASQELRLTDALLRFATHLRHGRLHPPAPAPAPLRAALEAGALAPYLLACQPRTRSYQQLLQAWQATLAAACPEDSARLLTGPAALYRRVALNLERLRWEADPEAEYVLVNIPAYQLVVVSEGRVVRQHRVIVGRPELPTPTLDSRITALVTAPDWLMPYSMAVQELLPKLQRDPGFLRDNGYELLNQRTGQRVNPWRVNWRAVTPATFRYHVRQPAGPTNALGQVVFYFPNRHRVFLHDTPARAGFGRPGRALSHGCVRVENPWPLAAYLLRREGQEAALRTVHPSAARVQHRRFELPRGLAVHIRYYTCAGEAGQLRCYPDVYQQDPALESALFARP